MAETVRKGANMERLAEFGDLAHERRMPGGARGEISKSANKNAVQHS
ncbi:hypothetical protein [Noviherbaspirillum sp. UKPF54]|nr:hypothetical protein [Noviherbaspirillum sp. UKPF54]